MDRSQVTQPGERHVMGWDAVSIEVKGNGNRSARNLITVAFMFGFDTSHQDKKYRQTQYQRIRLHAVSSTKCFAPEIPDPFEPRRPARSDIFFAGHQRAEGGRNVAVSRAPADRLAVDLAYIFPFGDTTGSWSLTSPLAESLGITTPRVVSLSSPQALLI